MACVLRLGPGFNGASSPRTRRDIPSAARLPRGWTSVAALGFAPWPSDQFAFIENEEARQAFLRRFPRTQTVMSLLVFGLAALHHGTKAVSPAAYHKDCRGFKETLCQLGSLSNPDFNFFPSISSTFSIGPHRKRL
jgi:hypothetical protein